MQNRPTKNLPKPRESYLNFSHLHSGVNFDEIVTDSKNFSKEQLLTISLDASIEKSVRETALYMLGAQWDKEALSYIRKILKSFPELADYIEDLLKLYDIKEAKELAFNLSDEGIISTKRSNFISKLIDENILYKRNPKKDWGFPVFKN